MVGTASDTSCLSGSAHHDSRPDESMLVSLITVSVIVLTQECSCSGVLPYCQPVLLMLCTVPATEAHNIGLFTCAEQIVVSRCCRRV
jgi:hypothetical protein